MKAHVYIIERSKNREFYIGSTENLERRVREHQAGKVAATRNKRPYKLVFSQEFENIDIAKKVERKIKSWKRKDFVERIIRDGFIKNVGA